MRNFSLLALDRQIDSECLGLVKRLLDLAQDLRWTWSHAGDSFWHSIDSEIWRATRNPYVVLQERSIDDLQTFANDAGFLAALDKVEQSRHHYLSESTWGDEQQLHSSLQGVAYFTMEIGLGPALPLYAGGLGILAGDFIKGASDMSIPVTAFSLLYKQGYFRQTIDADGWQQEIFSYNDTLSLPIRPTLNERGAWLHVGIELPGRTIQLRVWQANVGRNTLYLLDSDCALNLPSDRGATGTLYGGTKETRLIQEMALGIGGWRVIEALKLNVSVCHMNEGHSAFAALERARSAMAKHQLDFESALWATRAGNVFTTHTTVDYAFDRFSQPLFEQYLGPYAEQLNIELSRLWQLGQSPQSQRSDEFNMAYLAMHTSGQVNAVSQLHGKLSQRLFNSLYPRWPDSDTPIAYVSNGVHMPSWDSAAADSLWTESCGKDRWRCGFDESSSGILNLDDERIWQCRSSARKALVTICRERLARRSSRIGRIPAEDGQNVHVLDPNTLTIGFARRFTDYKRTNLLLNDQDRLARLLNHSEYPVQIVIAGKAHPKDEHGKKLLRRWARFVERPDVRLHAVLIEDYDISIAQFMVQGVDVWINTPRRGWEACGTSGMKVLVNGGLNLSSRDGWWAEAFDDSVGWAFGSDNGSAGNDDEESAQLYDLLERHVVPEFYQRDERGLPAEWIARIRTSMSVLTPKFSSNRMLQQYTENMYIPAARHVQERLENNGQLGRSIHKWHQHLLANWHELHWGELQLQAKDRTLEFSVALYLADIPADSIEVQLFANPLSDTESADSTDSIIHRMQRAQAVPGAVNAHVYCTEISTDRSATDFTPRVIPAFPTVNIPLESTLVCWYSGS